MVIRLTTAELRHCKSILQGISEQPAGKQSDSLLQPVSVDRLWASGLVYMAFQKLLRDRYQIATLPLADALAKDRACPAMEVNGWRICVVPGIRDRDWLLVDWEDLARQYEGKRLAHLWVLAAPGWVVEADHRAQCQLTGAVDFLGYTCLHRLRSDLVNTKTLYQGHELPDTDGHCVENDCFAIQRDTLYDDWSAFQARLKEEQPFAAEELYTEMYREIQERIQFNRVCETFDYIIHSPELKASERGAEKSSSRHSLFTIS